MSENVLSFEDFESERQIAAFQTALPRVVLEGGDDVVLFKRFWFPDFLDRFEFVKAADLIQGEGCTAVKTAVEKSQQDGIPAFGLTDRDWLFRSSKWDLLFATDDGVFDAATADADCATNSRWEIEAYLLEPDTLPSWVRGHHKTPPGSEAECASALQRAIDECEHLLHAQRWFGAAHSCGAGVANGHFCNRPPAEFNAAWQRELAGIPDGAATAQEIGTHIAEVLRLAPTVPAERLRWLLRYVDTKRLVLRLEHRLSVKGGKVKWALADLMLQTGRRPEELERRLGSITPRLNS